MTERSTAATASFDRWFGYPRASAPTVAFDGGTVYVLSDRGGIPHAWAVPRDGGTPVAFWGGSERVAQVVPRPNAPGAIVSVDRGGNEHFQLLLVDGEGRTVRPLTDAPERIHRAGAWNEKGAFFFTANSRDVRFFDVYRVDPHTATPPAVVRAEDALVDLVDAKDDRVLLLRSNTNIDRDILLREGSLETNLLPHDGEVAVFDVAFGQDGVLAAANPDRELAALVALGREGHGPELLLAFDGDVERVAVDRSGRSVCLTYNDRGRSRLVLYDRATAEAREVGLPCVGVIGTIVADPRGEGFFFDLSSTELGTEVFAVEGSSATVRQLTRSPQRFPGAPVRATEVEVVASDGLRVPSWWYEPPVPAKGTVVHVHGGPEVQARPAFSPLYGFLLEQGYRIVAPNVRGSMGYGRTYVHLDDVRRRMDSVRDLFEVVEALRAGRTPVPVGPAGRIGVMGGSYGGFMVLASITTYPELFDAAVDIVGIANFVTFLEKTGPWRRKYREDEYGSLEHDRAFLESISPLHRADRIVTPLMVVHGQNDPRVPLYEAEQIVRALRGRGVAVDFLAYDNEGHGLVRRENQREAYVRAAAFFDEHLARASEAA